MTAKLQKTQVDLTGLMRVLGEALYSTPFVAVRELVQNAHDSCTRRRGVDQEFAPRIDVEYKSGSLIFSDNGAGLTESEIHAYLATVGTGFTRTMRDEDDASDLIGYFGLGFLSAFAVSEKVEFWTSSYQSPTLAHRFTSRNGETYSVEVAPPRSIGSELRLSLRNNLIEFSHQSIKSWLHRYCCLLRHPIFFHGEQVNAAIPPWRQRDGLTPLRFKKLALQFAESFDSHFEPLAVLPVAGESSELSGMLWIQGGLSYDSSDNRSLAVYVRGMLITHENRDLLPRWAGFVSGVIESSELRPTASRESLREDAFYQQAQLRIAQSLRKGLADLSRSDAASWQRVLSRHNDGLLGAAIVDDELFELLAESLTVPTTEGDLSMQQLLARGEQAIFVAHSEKLGAESILLRALKKPVVLGGRFGASRFCERYAQRRGKRLVLLGTDDGEAHLFKQSELSVQQQADLQQWFAAEDTEVLARQFAPINLPFAVVPNREAELKRRLEADHADKRAGQGILGLVRHYTASIKQDCTIRLYINAANPIVQRLFLISDRQRRDVLNLLQSMIVLNSGIHAGAAIEVALEQLNLAVLAFTDVGSSA